MRRCRAWCGVWGLLVAALPAAADAGQNLASVLGQPVVGVRFEVEGRPEVSPTIVAVSEVRLGEPLRLEDIRATIANLDGLNLYDDVQSLAMVLPGGVEILFQLTPRHPVNRLEVTG